MSKFTKELVESYANDLLFHLTDEENELVLKEFDEIEKNMEEIASLPNITDTLAMTHTLDDFSFTLREDEIEETPDIEDLLKNCKSIEDREISVPKVVNNNVE